MIQINFLSFFFMSPVLEYCRFLPRYLIRHFFTSNIKFWAIKKFCKFLFLFVAIQLERGDIGLITLVPKVL